jgi:WD40 repeat protein
MDMQNQQDRSSLNLFYSYADKDEKLCEELEKHLSILQRQRIIDGWHRRKILLGADKDRVHDEQFSSAQIICLLISPDFLDSNAAYVEMKRALQRHQAGLSYVIPLLLRPGDYEQAPFAQLQVLPRNGKAVMIWENSDAAFADIAKDIRLAIQAWNSPSGEPSLRPLASGSSAPFLCSAHKDRPLLERIKEDLRGMMGEEHQQAAQENNPDEDEKIEEAIRPASAVIVVASPSTRYSPWVKQVLEIAKMYQRPLYLFWMQGDLLQEVLPTDYDYLPSIDARGERYVQALQELIQALGRQRSFSAAQSPLPEPLPLPDPRNPYKGLQPFRMEDAQDFFGRERLIEELLEKVKQLHSPDQRNQATARLLTILGPSGSGKSSVVMAGLLPKLKQGALTGSEHWIYLDPIAPGKHPLEALTLTLTPLFPERSLKSIREDLEDDSTRGLHLLLTTYAKQSGMNVLLVIDQFEELFTQTATKAELQQFLNVLLAAVSEPHGPLMTLLTLRADFYDQPLLYPELGRIIEDHHVTCYPLESRDLRAVIEKPAQLPKVQLTFEGDLVGDLLFEVRGQVGTLPLLQFTLDQLFQYREGRLLTLRAYQQIGGVKGALAQHAEATYQSLPTKKHQQLTRALFLRLINPGTVEEDATRRRIPRSELVVVDQEETAKLADVTSLFTQARLLTTSTVGGVSTVEVSHEALIQVWTRLQNWLHEARYDVHLQRVISEDTAEWNRYGQPADRLYHGSQLAEALVWREANLPSLDEDRFLQAGIERRYRLRRRAFLIGLAGVAGMAGTGFLATALFRKEPNPPPPTGFPEGLSSYTYKEHTGIVSSVAWSPDGKRIASASYDKTVQVWDATSHSTYKGHTNQVNSVAWSLDGKRIASGSDDKTVRVWDASTGNLLLTYTGHSDPVLSVAWSPDGKRIASGSRDNTVQVWNASSSNLLLTYTGHSSDVRSVVWEPSGKRIASGSDDKTVQVWDASSGSPLLTYKGHVNIVTSVAWSPDSKRIASGSWDSTVQIWDASSGSPLLTKGRAIIVTSVAWSPDSKRIASGSVDKTVQVWDANTGNLLLTHKDHISDVNSIMWSPDGKRIASGSNDKTVQVWDVRVSSPLLTYKGHTSAVFSVAWEPSGKLITSGSDDHTVQIWDASSGNLLLTYTGHSDPVLSVAWSPDGKRIASASRDKTVQVWDISSGSPLLTYTGHTNAVLRVAWEPSGKRIASGSIDHTVQIWDASSGNLLLTYKGHTDTGYSVAWSPDGKRIASGSADKTVQVWDANTGNLLLTYKGHSALVNSAVWSPDGKRIASGSYDKTVQVWDVSHGDLLLTYKGHTGGVQSVAWEPSGKRIASGSWDDNTVQVWDASSGSLLLTCKGHSDFVNSVAWSPDGKRIASGSDDKTVQVWAWA